jgi:hypothetical protein
MKKLYCYVDESGQHTEGAYFLVSVVIVAEERDQIEALLLKIEQTSRKRKLKWTRSRDEYRTAYIKAVLSSERFKNRLFSAFYQTMKDYVGLTVSTTAEAIQAHTQTDYKATVIVDGLRKSERNQFAVELRKLGVRTQKVVGGDDRTDAFIRLADALCGFVADAIQGRDEYATLLRKAQAEEMLTMLH